MASSGIVLLAGLVAVVCLVLYKRRRNGRAAASSTTASARSGAKGKRKPPPPSGRPRTTSSQQQPTQPKPANSHSLTSGSSNQDELLRAYEYARRHPSGSSLQAAGGGAMMHYDAPDDGHTTGSEGSTDPGIRQFTESPPEPNERRQAACITPGSGGN
ncbi:hypothetical protein V5799_025303 [Amblyomma americanum]|uniref:Uncharacterized protein n=1 Tax=Amblyomma americanum TaxID=6943 RepID=A0AAQ4E9Y2_AMBAM